MRVALTPRAICVVVYLLVGCEHAPAPATANPCTQAVRGSRYALCGKLVSAGDDLRPTHGFRAIGAFESMPERVSNRYSIQGGSFSAQR